MGLSIIYTNCMTHIGWNDDNKMGGIARISEGARKLLGRIDIYTYLSTLELCVSFV